MKYVLGISAYYHDSAAALVQGGKILAAAQEERFSRKKNDAAFPDRSIRYCLKEAGISFDQVDAVVFYDKPFLTFERLLETYLVFAPKGFRSFALALPVWLKEKLFLKSRIRKELKRNFHPSRSPMIYFSEHHLSHAASAFFPSPFEEAAILTLDGVGEWSTAGIFLGRGAKIEALKEMRFPHSWGLYYSAFTQFLGFKVNSGEYKLMGLAPYGDPRAAQTLKFREIIETELIQINDDGSLQMNMDYFNYATGNTMIPIDKWEALFQMSARTAESELKPQEANLAWAAQSVLEDGIIRAAREAKKLTGAKNLVMAGGVALNCVANAKVRSAGIFEDVWIQPAADDAGGALGAALAFSHIALDEKRHLIAGRDAMNGSYLGPEYSDQEILETLSRYQIPFKKCSHQDELCDVVASLLKNGKIVGWHQGRLEWGPRALGNRSILASAKHIEMQKKLNLSIKFRESFRPFAPVVLLEDVGDYFEFHGSSPYMQFTAPVKAGRLNTKPADFHQWDIGKKLSFPKSDLPAITHIDDSARLQTVDRHLNPLFWSLLTAYREIAGCSVLVNTSFNVRGEPIVCTPEDSLGCFLMTEMDVLAIGSFVIHKVEIPDVTLQSWRKTLGTRRNDAELD